eukprot:CAMPEP_0202902986 /NCGR_PEP_ID=MMETSP1392-20130828/20185_1 /ASSEMBLY_ACC=CAM_ASM_000868 /TAXON_ID=225041 /ORGANISM="Chlamydomonas chlamydogama, Strain SAG 11-48b" /LENGTH=83 /DNA_ID=CAMNT_0049589921 /DNA_START=272 /DNA_END=520 /DNA_ORIENTATION=+
MSDHTGLREVLEELYGVNEASEFDDDDLKLLWQNKYRKADHLVRSNRQSLVDIKLPARLIDIIHPPVGQAQACLSQDEVVQSL